MVRKVSDVARPSGLSVPVESSSGDRNDYCDTQEDENITYIRLCDDRAEEM